jgi:hypothetical protein
VSWCDKLASTPGVGFRLDPHFAPSEIILNALAPTLDQWFEDDKRLFNIERQNDPFTAGFNTNDGFQYGIEPSKIFVVFNHSMRFKQVSGGPPVLEMLSRASPYTELLPKVSKRLTEVTLLLPAIKTRKVTRVGIISTTIVADDEAPPGIARFIKYIGRPWQGVANTYNIRITAEIDRSPHSSDRCTHSLSRPEDPEELLSLKFDWQRTFDPGRPITLDSLQEILVGAEKASNKYFEDLAEGSRFDEDIIRITA